MCYILLQVRYRYYSSVHASSQAVSRSVLLTAYVTFEPLGGEGGSKVKYAVKRSRTEREIEGTRLCKHLC